MTDASKEQLRLPADLERMVDLSQTTPPADLTVACYVYPQWHP
ncbi:MAG: hypothetical protein QOF73_1628, partial [Thermomicrobiales bacterium]|nr:hypothetical protein [Thermomicrobiales bacterium]